MTAPQTRCSQRDFWRSPRNCQGTEVLERLPKFNRLVYISNIFPYMRHLKIFALAGLEAILLYHGGEHTYCIGDSTISLSSQLVEGK